MIGKRETIDDILLDMENCIAKRDAKYTVVESDYPFPEGNKNAIESKYYSEYKTRKDAIAKWFDREFLALQDMLDDSCKKTRLRQPHFTQLGEKNLNYSGKIPRNIVLGRIRAQYKHFDALLPHVIPFPIKKPLTLSSDGDTETLFSLILRLMYTLPVGKLELNAFDPNFFGASFQQYNALFTDPEISPMGKVCGNKDELSAMLKQAVGYAENLIQHVFSSEDGMDNWSDYNRTMYSRDLTGAILPYKIFFICDVPDNMNDECMSLLMRLSNICERCGMLLAMTIDKEYFARRNAKNYVDEKTLDIEDFLNDCLNIDEVLWETSLYERYKHFTVTNCKESLPDNAVLGKLIRYYKNAVAERKKQGGSFFDIFDSVDTFSLNSIDGVDAALGIAAGDSSEVQLHFGNSMPHALIGGTTGAGKSNLLHVMIANLCKRYSPDELKLFLLDFKEGVEFNVYASEFPLPHAALVATEADVEYGISVLRHISQAIKNRYSLFKQSGNLKQYSDFRRANPDADLARLLVVIDEFQVLFAGKEGGDAVRLLGEIAKQGRAAGVHLVMATQSYKNLGNTANGNFSQLLGQFGGRVALKCTDAYESAAVLGAGSNENGAAAFINVPMAILNTCSGLKSANVLFSVPNADGCPRYVTEVLNRQWCRKGHIIRSKVYNGDILPVYPDYKEYESCGTAFLLGETADYESKKYKLVLPDKPNCNLIICGDDFRLSEGLRKSVMLSAQGSEVEEVVIVGDGYYPKISKTVIHLEKLTEFQEILPKLEPGKRRIVIFDNCNFKSELNYKFPLPSYSQPSLELKALEDFIKATGVSKTHIVAFYDSPELYKDSGICPSSGTSSFSFAASFGIPYKGLSVFNNYLSLVHKEGFLSPKRVLMLRSGEYDGMLKPYCDELVKHESDDVGEEKFYE